MTSGEAWRRGVRWALLGTCMNLGLAATPSAWAQPGPSAPAVNDPPTPAKAGSGRPAVAPSRPLALLVGRPGERTTRLHLAAIGLAAPLALPASVATLAHPPFATLRAATQGSDVAVVVDEGERGDHSFASALVRMRPHEPPQRLIGGVAYASRPLPIAGTTEVLVSRGVIAQAANGSRDDDLTIDAVDLRTGKARGVMRAQGNALFLAGMFGDEIIIDRIDGSGSGSLIAVHHKTGALRVVAAHLSPFARDFAIDDRGHAVVFADRHETDTSRWVVDRIDLRSGSRDRLHEDTFGSLAPQIWSDGSLALTRDPDRPLERFDIGHGLRGAALNGASRGVGRVADVDAIRSLLAITVSDGGGLPVLSIVAEATGTARVFPLPQGERVTVAGFVTTTPSVSP